MTNHILIDVSSHAKVIEKCIVASGGTMLENLDNKCNSMGNESTLIKGKRQIQHTFN